MNKKLNPSNEEIDLFYLFKKINEFIRGSLVAAYRFSLFLIKNWVILLSLIIIGVITGYYTQKNIIHPKKSSIVIRVNFNSANYIYNSVDLLNNKIANNDSIFLSKEGFWQNRSLLKLIEIEPIVNFNDLIDEYGTNNNTLKALIENYEGADGSTASESFKLYYKYHKLDLILDRNATAATVENLINYFNNNELLSTLKIEGNKRLVKRIEGNDEIIMQINSILNSYNSKESTVSSSNQITLDKDLTGLVEKKTILLYQNKELTEELVLSDGIAVLINKGDLVESKPRLSQKKIIVYPILLVGLFLLFALLRRTFESAKKMAEAEDGKVVQS